MKLLFLGPYRKTFFCFNWLILQSNFPNEKYRHPASSDDFLTKLYQICFSHHILISHWISQRGRMSLQKEYRRHNFPQTWAQVAWGIYTPDDPHVYVPCIFFFILISYALPFQHISTYVKLKCPSTWIPIIPTMNKGNIDRILHTKQKQYQQWIKAIINFRKIKKQIF